MIRGANQPTPTQQQTEQSISPHVQLTAQHLIMMRCCDSQRILNRGERALCLLPAVAMRRRQSIVCSSPRSCRR